MLYDVYLDGLVGRKIAVLTNVKRGPARIAPFFQIRNFALH
jgi:hypothetical protein